MKISCKNRKTRLIIFFRLKNHVLRDTMQITLGVKGEGNERFDDR